MDKYRVPLFLCIDKDLARINRFNCSVITVYTNKHIIERGFTFIYILRKNDLQLLLEVSPMLHYVCVCFFFSKKCALFVLPLFIETRWWCALRFLRPHSHLISPVGTHIYVTLNPLCTIQLCIVHCGNCMLRLSENEERGCLPSPSLFFLFFGCVQVFTCNAKSDIHTVYVSSSVVFCDLWQGDHTEGRGLCLP